MDIRSARETDGTALAAIYNHYIRSTIITFEEDEVDGADMSARISDTIEQELPYLIADVDGDVAGYAYASKWKGRCAYRYSVEVTVYLAPDATGSGLGSALYTGLLDELRARNYHIAIAGISLPNPASVALHEKFGMHKVAHFEQVGFKFGDWVDVGYWQCEL